MSNPFEEIERRLGSIETLLLNMEPPKKEELKYLSREEVCTILKITLPTLNTYTKKGIIKGSRIGTRVLYRNEDIQEALTDASGLKYRRQ
jgi:excisionase family DNA binding protein